MKPHAHDALAPSDGASDFAWSVHGVSVQRSVLAPDEVDRVENWVQEVENLPEAPEGPLQHREQTDAGPVMARSEYFADVHPALGNFLRGTVADVVESVCGEPVNLFKEKVNYKYPGGGGFAPHQDARAYRFAKRHISVMVPLDEATVENGCLWFAGSERTVDPSVGGLLPSDGRGRIAEDVVERLRWHPVEVGPGDLVVFDSFAPHYSETNNAARPRRAMYLTYNAAAEGDFRAAYYEDKLAEFSQADGTFDGDRVRISISDDFLGRAVDAAGGTRENPA